MLRIAICDDEAYFAGKLQKMVSEYLNEKALCAEIHTFSSGEELAGSGMAFQILLMDIRLPGKNGLEIAERLKSQGRLGQVIFITSYEKYAVHAFDLDAVHYLLKPVRQERLSMALDKARKRGDSQREKSILLTKNGTAVRVLFRDILYCEVFDHQSIVHCSTESFRLYDALDALEQRLDGRFFRCHRSYLVNMDAVVEKKEGYAIVTGGGRVLIARRKQAEFTKQLLRACRLSCLPH